MNSARDRFVQAAAGGEDALSWLGLAHVYMLTGDREGALTAFERGAEIDSTLSLPFVRAWKGTLQTAVKPEAQPALARVLRSAGAAAAENGEAATNTLVSYVLEGWSFDDAEGARADIRASVADTTRSGYDTPPIPIEKVDPVYPDDAEEAGTEGTVQVTVTVSEAGHVIDARIERCNAPDAMCESALAAARKWTFRPATRYGSPVRASLVLPFRFMRRGE